jgi:ubiquinone biosynthesis protein UbiJ
MAARAAYNRRMTREPIPTLLSTAVVERAVLVLNHLLGAEPAAAERLRTHAGRRVECTLADWPAALPPLPSLLFVVTPAGLLEWSGPQPPQVAPDLHLRVEAGNPALALLRAAAGERPPVSIQGDAAFARDLNWLLDHLRWDAEDDLARLVGPGAAHQLVAAVRPLAHGVRAALRGLAAAVDRGAARGAP